MRFNPKGILLWAAMFGIAICCTMAYGPTAGMGAFFLLVVAIYLLG